MTSGAGSRGWFQGNPCLQWAPSLGGRFPPPPPPSFLPPHRVTNQEGPIFSFLTYPCHLSSYSLEGRSSLLETLVLPSPGRRSRKQTPQRPLSSPPISERMLAWGEGLHHYKEVLVTFPYPYFRVLENLTQSSVETGSPCFFLESKLTSDFISGCKLYDSPVLGESM